VRRSLCCQYLSKTATSSSSILRGKRTASLSLCSALTLLLLPCGNWRCSQFWHLFLTMLFLLSFFLLIAPATCTSENQQQRPRRILYNVQHATLSYNEVTYFTPGGGRAREREEERREELRAARPSKTGTLTSASPTVATSKTTRSLS